MDPLSHITWILAPMDGITDRCYRNAWMEVFGAYSRMRWAVSPFVTLVRGEAVKPSHLVDLWPQHNRMEIEPQILGNETEFFPPMAKALEDMGYISVNWNLGCPMKRVAHKRRGSGLLPYPQMIDAFLDKAFSTGTIGISVKIRLGYYKKEEIYPVMEVLNRYPLRYVAVHPRIGTQLYGGQVDWDALEEARALCRHPLVHSGDIDSVGRAEAFARRFPGISRVMIGRGVIADPFLPCRLCGERFSEESQRSLFAGFVAALLRHYTESDYPESTVLQRQKMFWSRFSGAFVPQEGFDTVKRTESLAQYRQACKKLFDKDF
ncbi:MAG: tRNA-dihydrouridine synthase family protein [Bacteroides sp.]|nr:tRNA-dihydrouridine synthase family protein [Ruminococcus flavefaciens]MCM1554000.1 tRNA-dihydrouridine synthase family protein [Bacteroides sp.]